MGKQGKSDKPIGFTEWLNNLVIRENTLNAKMMWFYNSFKIRCKTRILECEPSCSITTHDNLLHTLGELQIPENAFGLRMSQEIFLMKIDQIYEHYRDAVERDDVEVFGNEKTHERNLHEAMECTRKAGIKLNFDQCIIKTNCWSFW